MTTQDDLNAIQRLLDKRQTVPSPLIKSLLATCNQLKKITEMQSAEIKRLTAERAQVEAVQR